MQLCSETAQIPHSYLNLPSSFPLDNAYVCGSDGLVQHNHKLYYHFQKYDWDLENAENNPKTGEHKRRVVRRLEDGKLDTEQAHFLKGSYLLGISPFITSYYHFVTDLLHSLVQAPPWPILIPENLPKNYIKFLHQCGFKTHILSSHIYQIEQLWIPMLTESDWTPEKVTAVQSFAKNIIPSQPTFPSQRLYISRKLAGNRHLINEEDFLPILHQYGFQRIFLEQLTIKEQIHLMRKTSHVIAPHGAGLISTVFTAPQTHILEIRPILSSGQFCFEKLCACGWDNYEYLVPPKSGTFHLPPEMLHAVLNRWFLKTDPS